MKGIEIKTNTEVTDDMLVSGEADVVILATGGENIVPDIEGLDQPMVCEASRILNGQVPPGKNAVVIGGGLIGMETADFLAQKRSKITVKEFF